MVYKLFIRFSLTGVVVRYLRVSSKRDLYTYLGFVFTHSIEHVERVSYKVVGFVPNPSAIIDFDRWAYVNL